MPQFKFGVPRISQIFKILTIPLPCLFEWSGQQDSQVHSYYNQLDPTSPGTLGFHLLMKIHEIIVGFPYLAHDTHSKIGIPSPAVNLYLQSKHKCTEVEKRRLHPIARPGLTPFSKVQFRQEKCKIKWKGQGRGYGKNKKKNFWVILKAEFWNWCPLIWDFIRKITT